MLDLDGSLARSQEAGRLRERVLREQGRALAHAARLLDDAVGAGRRVHVLGEGRFAPLAIYLAEVLHRSGDGLIAAAPLGERARGKDAVLRAVSCFVASGDVLLLVGAAPGGLRTVAAARGKLAKVLGLLAPRARDVQGSCDAAVLVPGEDLAAVAEVILALGHVLAGALGRAGEAEGRAPTLVPLPAPTSRYAEPPRAASPPPTTPSITDLGVIDRDTGSAEVPLGAGLDHEGALLAAALEAGAAPPTDPRGVTRRQRPPADGPPATGPHLRFRCGGCEEVIVVEARFAGRRGRCPACACEFMIPRPETDATATQRAPLVPRERATGRHRRSERRRAPRINVRDGIVRAARGAFPDGRTYHEPHTLDDLSLTGLSWSGRDPGLQVGEACYLSLDVPAFPRPVLVRAEVRRVTRRGPDTWAVGVRFSEFVADAEERIQRLLDVPQLRAVRRR